MRAAFAVTVLLALTSSAYAQDEEAPAEGAEEEAAPPSASPYVTAVREAMTTLHAGDVDAAISALRTLTTESPNEAAAHCHLGTAMLRQSQMGPAIESFQTCARVARQQGDALHEGRGLLNAARLLVIDTSKRTEARQALSALTQFAQTHGDVLDPALVGQMQSAFDAIVALDQSAAQVRQRREQRAADAAE